MTKIILTVDGMMCGMCEAHINELVRKNFNIKKVNSNHSKNQTEIIVENDILDEEILKVFEPTGYKITEIKREEYKKKGIFSIFSK